MDNPSAMEALEVKLAFLERHLEQVDQTLYEQERRMQKLERAVRLLHERMQATAQADEDPLPPNEKPPHY